MMKIEELSQLADDFLRKNYNMALEIPIVRNNRLRTVMGRYHYNVDGFGTHIEIAGFMFKYAARATIIDVLYHECVHYALHERGEPSDDGHPHFEGELRRLGISATETRTVGECIEYECASCGDFAFTINKRVWTNRERFRTQCCDAPLIRLRKRIYDGTEAVT